MAKRASEKTMTCVRFFFRVPCGLLLGKRCILDGKKRFGHGKRYFISMAIRTYIGATKIRDLTMENMLRYVLVCFVLYHVGFFLGKEKVHLRWEKKPM
jgi:hypothetical protein